MFRLVWFGSIWLGWARLGPARSGSARLGSFRIRTHPNCLHISTVGHARLEMFASAPQRTSAPVVPTIVTHASPSAPSDGSATQGTPRTPTRMENFQFFQWFSKVGAVWNIFQSIPLYCDMECIPIRCTDFPVVADPSVLLLVPGQHQVVFCNRACSCCALGLHQNRSLVSFPELLFDLSAHCA